MGNGGLVCRERPCQDLVAALVVCREDRNEVAQRGSLLGEVHQALAPLRSELRT